MISRRKFLTVFALIFLVSSGSASVYSVSIDDLPSRYPERNLLEVSGSAQGSSLDSIKVLYRRGGSTEWVELESSSCGGSSCSLTANFISSWTGYTDFVFVGRSGETAEISEKETVVFTEVPPEDLIDSVDLETVDEAETGVQIGLNASTTGENLETLKIQRKIGASWADISSSECQQENTCEAETEYSSDESDDQQFRARITAGDQSQNSRIETISFTEPYTPPEITDVDIGSLPQTHQVSRNLEIRGDAEGSGIQRIEVQRKNQNSSEWSAIREKNCNEVEYCEVSTGYSSEVNTTQNFRISAYTYNSSLSSSTETVEFTERTQQNPAAGIDSVTVEDLPRYVEAGDSIDISAEASGNRIESLELLKRYENRNTDWIKVKDKDCSSSESCSVTKEDFTSQREEGVGFVAKARAGGESTLSDIEIVEFFGRSGGGERDRDSDDARLEVRVEDENGDDLEDAFAEVENGDFRSKYTDEDGEVYFWLEPGDYEVHVSKNRYETESRNVELDENDYRTLSFELDDDEDYESSQISVGSLEYRRKVCQGENLRVNFDLRNRENSDTTLAVWGAGLGGVNTRVVEIDRKSTIEESLVFRDIEYTGNREFTVYAKNSDTARATGNVNVENCDGEDRRADRTFDVTVGLTPEEVFTGETVKVSGRVVGADKSYPVTVRFGSEVRETSSDRDGRYQIFFKPDTVGNRVVDVSAAGFSKRKNLEVLPRARVSQITAPGKVFSGEQFEICGRVESDVEAEILLLRDGKVLDSQKDSGETCFQLNNEETGSHLYTVRALTYGESSEAVKRVEVVASGEKFQTFPEKIVSIEKEPGMAKFEIYNRNSDTKEFEISVDGIDQRWISSTSKNVVLPGGGRETVYFYLNAEKTGNFTPEIQVLSSGEKLYEETIELESENARQSRTDYFLAALNQEIFG